MHTREFLFRFKSTYTGDDNQVADLQVWKQVDGDWVDFDFGVRSPGFEMFCLALLTCQHTYLRLNCAEKGILLDHVDGEMHLSAGEDWEIHHLLMSFSASPRSGVAEVPDSETIDYIIERLQHCPVSVNMRPIADCSVLFAFVGH